MKTHRRYTLLTAAFILVFIFTIYLLQAIANQINQSPRERFLAAGKHIENKILADPNYCFLLHGAQFIDPNLVYVSMIGYGRGRPSKWISTLGRYLPNRTEIKLHQVLSAYNKTGRWIEVEIHSPKQDEILQLKNKLTNNYPFPDIPIKFRPEDTPAFR
jgi:hypothetical protein